MKHLALRARCTNSEAAYTATGLGDRIHSAIVGWAYGQGEPVTLHLTAHMMRGGRFANKPESWKEVLSLFPAGSLSIKCHDVTPETEAEWLAYLHRKGIPAEQYAYHDYAGRFETVRAPDIVPLLREIPPLTAAPQSIDLPKRFVTVQWDASAKSRQIPFEMRAAVLKRYAEDGFAAVVVGGEASDDRLKWSLKHIAYAMSKAALHVGVDSAFFHLAQLYMPWSRIHLYNLPSGFYSHHARRARDNGAVVNLYL